MLVVVLLASKIMSAGGSIEASGNALVLSAVVLLGI
jgi:hypothetical protein